MGHLVVPNTLNKIPVGRQNRFELLSIRLLKNSAENGTFWIISVVKRSILLTFFSILSNFNSEMARAL